MENYIYIFGVGLMVLALAVLALAISTQTQFRTMNKHMRFVLTTLLKLIILDELSDSIGKQERKSDGNKSKRS